MTMTPFQFEGLQLLGYTRRESEFLFLVATHSGYFTNHQFKSFAQTESGSVSNAFVRKLLDRKHATYRAYRSGERVYHLFARKVYQAIERENLRTRKQHELEYVKSRLVALDFVLAHREHRYLETELEKLRFFETECKLQREVLPAKLYRARRSADVTPRYFVDRFPFFLNTAFTPPVLTFTYVDSGAVTLEGFATHLRGYLALFRSLARFDFIYIAPTVRLFRAAESEFRCIVSSQRSEQKSVSLLDYFRLRSAWDRKERVASAGVVALKEAQSRYAGKHFDEFYELWRKGNAGDDEVLQFAKPSSHAPKGVFRTLVCGSSLKVFADPLAKMAESWADGGLSSSPTRGFRNQFHPGIRLMTRELMSSERIVVPGPGRSDVPKTSLQEPKASRRSFSGRNHSRFSSHIRQNPEQKTEGYPATKRKTGLGRKPFFGR